MTAKIDDYEPADLDLTFPAIEAHQPQVPKPPRPAPRVPAPQQRRSWRIVFAAAGVALIFGLGTCTGDRLNDAEVRGLMLEANEASVRASAAANEAHYWQSEATSATAAYEAVESDVASLTASLLQWQLQAQEASSTIATLRQQKATPKPAQHAPTRVSYNTAGVEQWRSLVAAYFPAENVDAALSVMRKESGGNPSAKGPVMKDGSQCAGLMQQHPKYWSGRLAAAEAVFGDLPDSIYDPRANIAVSAYLSNGGRDWSHWSAKP